jgi:predicted tellurium resistance membrane protein TerC
VIWGSGILATLMNRWAWIVWLGGGILGYVAGEVALEDPVITGWIGDRAAGMFHYPLPVVLRVALTGLGWWLACRRRTA